VTTVRMTHSGLRDEQSVRNHESGWGKCSDNLDRTLTGRAGSDMDRNRPVG
jgi:hypothetical protein